MTEIVLSTHSIIGVCALVSAICGAWLKIRKVQKDRKKEKDLERALLLQEAKEFSRKNKELLANKLEILEQELNARLDSLSQKIDNVEESMVKDLEHVKNAYNSEIRFLGSKIEELKDEMRVQMSQVVQLVSKLIDKT